MYNGYYYPLTLHVRLYMGFLVYTVLIYRALLSSVLESNIVLVFSYLVSTVLVS